MLTDSPVYILQSAVFHYSVKSPASKHLCLHVQKPQKMLANIKLAKAIELTVLNIFIQPDKTFSVLTLATN
jgi:hypothetical protein